MRAKCDLKQCEEVQRLYEEINRSDPVVQKHGQLNIIGNKEKKFETFELSFSHSTLYEVQEDQEKYVLVIFEFKNFNRTLDPGLFLPLYLILYKSRDGDQVHLNRYEWLTTEKSFGIKSLIDAWVTFVNKQCNVDLMTSRDYSMIFCNVQPSFYLYHFYQKSSDSELAIREFPLAKEIAKFENSQINPFLHILLLLKFECKNLKNQYGVSCTSDLGIEKNEDFVDFFRSNEQIKLTMPVKSNDHLTVTILDVTPEYFERECKYMSLF